MPTLIRIICAWCGRDLGTKPCEPAQAGKISHGICDACAAALAEAA